MHLSTMPASLSELAKQSACVSSSGSSSSCYNDIRRTAGRKRTRQRLGLLALCCFAAVSLTPAAAVATTEATSTTATVAATTSDWIIDPVTLKTLPSKTVLVTGGAGFVGSHVADYLLSRGDTVVIVDEVNDYYDVTIKEGNLQMLQQKYNATNRLHFYRGDIVDDDFVSSVWEKHAQIDAVCHMAARAGVRPSILNPFIYLHSNIVGTVKLMEHAVQRKVGNFVFASSSSVYGGSPSVYFSELERVDRPISPYAATKKACELLAYVYHYLYGLNITALRFFTVFGERGRPDMAPFMFVDRVSRGVTISQFGDGTSSRDYTYIDDIVQGVVRSVDTPAPYQILNLGKGSGTVLKDFMSMVEKYVGKKAVVKVLPDQPGDVPYTCANITLAHDHLGYEATVPFSEGIKRTVAWYKQAYPQPPSESRRVDVDNSRSVASSKHRSRRRRRLASHAQHERPVPKQMQSVEDSFTDENDSQQLTELVRRVLREDSTQPLAGLEFERDLLDALLQERGEAAPTTASTRNDVRRRRRLQSDNIPHVERKKVLVTGGGGFVGSHVAEFLLARGDSVVLVENKGAVSDESTMSSSTSLVDANLSYLLEAYGDSGRLTIYRGDVCEADFVGRIFAEEKPEWICHLSMNAGSSTGVASNAVDLTHAHVESTVRLLELIKSTNSNSEDGDESVSYKVRNFVMAGSHAVYGRNADDTSAARTSGSNVQYVLRNEEDRVDYPKTPLGATAKTAELLAYTYHHLYQIPVSALRLFDVYGPRYHPNSVPFRMVNRLFSNAQNGGNDEAENSVLVASHDFAYIDDIVLGVVSALDRPQGYEIYNLGSGRTDACLQGTALQEFADVAATQSGNPQRVADESVSQSAATVDGVSCADIQKAATMLDYAPKTSLEDGLQKTIAWHQTKYFPNSLPPAPSPSWGNGDELDGTPEHDEGSAPALISSNAALVVALPETTPRSTSVSDGTPQEAGTTEFRLNATAVKVKTKREDTYFSNFPAWLRSLALMQWFLVATILFTRAYCKTGNGAHGRSHSSDSEVMA